MNREFLEGLGLEKETIDKVMAEHGKTVNTTKQELSDVTTERDTLQTTLKDRDEQLNALKDVKPDELKQQISDLQTANEDAKKEHDATVKDLQLTSAIKLALTGQVHDVDVAATLINKEKLVISDDGKVVGLDEQLAGLKESKAYLFKTDEPPATPNIFNPGNPSGGPAPTNNPFSEKSWNMTEQTRIFRENPDLYASLKAQAK